MPTGYTAPVEDGTITEFPEFAMNCARAFGALVMLRDSPNAEIPDEFPPSTYHRDELAKAHVALAELQTMSDEAKAIAAQAEYIRACGYANDYAIRVAETNGRYQAMLDQVEQWNPPTEEHIGLKNFMIQQLTDSMDSPTIWSGEPVEMTGDEWYERELERANRDVVYHAKNWDDEVRRCGERAAWVRALRESLA